MLLRFLLWACLPGPSATPPALVAGPPLPPARVAQVHLRRIRQQVARVQALRPRLRPVRPGSAQPGPEGNDLVGYFTGPALLLAHEVHAGDSGEAQTDYYFAGGRLIFAQQRETRYPLPGLQAASIRHRRYYFEHNRLVAWSEGNGRLRPPGVAAHSRVLLTAAQALRQQLGTAYRAALPH